MASGTSKRTGTSLTNIGRQIRKLKKSYKHAFRPHHGRFDIIDYLEAVLRLKWKAKNKNARRALRKDIRSVSRVKVRKGKGTLHTIMEASAGSAPARMRNRWVQALLYADKNRSLVGSKGLTEFLKANGGIAGCAAKMANVRISKQKRPSKLKRPLDSAAHNDEW